MAVEEHPKPIGSDAVCPYDESQDWTWVTGCYAELTLKGETWLRTNPEGLRKCLTCGQLFWTTSRAPEPLSGYDIPMAKMIVR